MLQGLMQDRPLLVSSIIEHARSVHPDVEIVSRTCEGPIHRTTYGQVEERARRVANMLAGLGVREGDRVATLAWNNHRHLELYFGISGMGAVVHTVNPRLFPEQLEYIINHGGAEYLFFDISFAPVVEKLVGRLPNLKAVIAMTDEAHMPSMQGKPLCYETLVQLAGSDYVWPQLDERSAASLCYTSGTTGNPKGVLYSQRSTLLHSMAMCNADGGAVSCRDSVLLVVPMFHVNAWGMPYACAMNGAKLVMPGPALDGKSIHELMRDEGVTMALGVPTVWLGLLQYMEGAGLRASELKLQRIVGGGSALPPAMFGRVRETLGATLIQAWGMTEMSPLGTMGTLLPKHDGMGAEERLKVQARQGRPAFGVDICLKDEDGKRLPHDGKTCGRLMVRGYWILTQYFRSDISALDSEGYFDTGDIAFIDADGYVQITDRSKDVIKSGGEWISSIDVENAMMGHPDVAMAAVIGVPHVKWQERPLLLVVPKPGTVPTRDQMLDYLGAKVAKWWLPDDVVFLLELPLSANGKVQKMKLREMFKDYQLQ